MIHDRRSIRLPVHDYSSDGAYYVTICTQGRLCLFGEVANGEMALNPAGEIVKQELLRTPEIRREMSLDTWVIMPNHVHAIVVINGSGYVGAHGRAPLRDQCLYRKPKSLSSFMAGFKSSVTKRINEMCNTPGKPVWQRNYWEHVIRNGNSYETIRRYIMENPLHWAQDGENPERKSIK